MDPQQHTRTDSSSFFAATKLVVITLVVTIAARAALLEYTDLIDPTESRYAVVAEEMVQSGNWLTPKLPMPEGVVPYLGKPPLHFWLTALSYSMFGIDEWTARLPSLLATIGILIAIWIFAAKAFDRQLAAVASLIYLSAWAPFFLAGGSVTDVTLAWLVTASTGTLYLAMRPAVISEADGLSRTRIPSRPLVLAAAAFAALAFLTKGPVGLVLIWLPLFLWSGLRRDFSWARNFPWLTASVAFLVLTVPWFVASEVANPGFLKYFFWNENIARYLFRDYGDRYGTGHVHWYGASWVMVAAAFCPWTFLLAAAWWRRRSAGTIEPRPCMRSQDRLFLWCWAGATPLFFTFVRQLHGMYLLPALPPLSIALAVLLFEDARLMSALGRCLSWRFSQAIFAIIVAGVLAGGMALDFDWTATACSVAVLLGGIYSMRHYHRLADVAATPACFASSFVSVYLVIILSMTPFVNIKRSCETALELVTRTDRCDVHERTHHVGVSSRNAFSHYWAAGAGNSELDEAVKVSFVLPEQAASSDVCHYLLKVRSLAEVPPSITAAFDLVVQSGDWLVFAKKHDHGTHEMAMLDRKSAAR